MNRIRLKYVFLSGVFLFIFSFLCGIFSFPYPDLPPEDVNIHNFFASLFLWSFCGGIGLMQIAIIVGIIKVLYNNLASMFSGFLVGIFLVVFGYFYGVYFALPLPNPPEGILWVFHFFASLTVFLVGLGLFLIILKNYLANEVLKRTSR
ncbi:MAG: hypothetical protein HQK63_05790 [Desulfamplus sp.]|nr:hypothetical protein [Desulfamplus sp.]